MTPQSIESEVQECERRFLRWLEEERQRLALEIEIRNRAVPEGREFAGWQEAAPEDEGDIQ